MGKGFRGKTCAYCAKVGAAATADHVFAREFFLKDDRRDLPKVPACSSCNFKKSKLEHYLATTLPFGGRHPDALTVINDMVPPRLAKNAKLHREIQAGHHRQVVNDNGRFVLAQAIPFESDRLAQLCGMMARGLSSFHWGHALPANCKVSAGMIKNEVTPAFEALFAFNGKRVSGRVGNGVFEYEALQSETDASLTLWKFRVLGGLQMMGDPELPAEIVTTIWVMTSARDLMPF